MKPISVVVQFEGVSQQRHDEFVRELATKVAACPENLSIPTLPGIGLRGIETSKGSFIIFSVLMSDKTVKTLADSNESIAAKALQDNADFIIVVRDNGIYVANREDEPAKNNITELLAFLQAQSRAEKSPTNKGQYLSDDLLQSLNSPQDIHQAVLKCLASAISSSPLTFDQLLEQSTGFFKALERFHEVVSAANEAAAAEPVEGASTAAAADAEGVRTCSKQIARAADEMDAIVRCRASKQDPAAMMKTLRDLARQVEGATTGGFCSTLFQSSASMASAFIKNYERMLNAIKIVAPKYEGLAELEQKTALVVTKWEQKLARQASAERSGQGMRIVGGMGAPCLVRFN